MNAFDSTRSRILKGGRAPLHMLTDLGQGRIIPLYTCNYCSHVKKGQHFLCMGYL